MAINKFANLTGPEFKALYGSGLSTQNEEEWCPPPEKCPAFAPPNLETVINWTAAGAVTQVEN